MLSIDLPAFFLFDSVVYFYFILLYFALLLTLLLFFICRYIALGLITSGGRSSLLSSFACFCCIPGPVGFDRVPQTASRSRSCLSSAQIVAFFHYLLNCFLGH